jgi:hypothetical protein
VSVAGVSVVVSSWAGVDVVNWRIGIDLDILSCRVHCRHRASGRELLSNAIVVDVHVYCARVSLYALPEPPHLRWALFAANTSLPRS